MSLAFIHYTYFLKSLFSTFLYLALAKITLSIVFVHIFVSVNVSVWCVRVHVCVS